jgi:hypothetical protein
MKTKSSLRLHCNSVLALAALVVTSLPLAAQALDEEAAGALREHLLAAHSALRLREAPAAAATADDDTTTPEDGAPLAAWRHPSDREPGRRLHA